MRRVSALLLGGVLAFGGGFVSLLHTHVYADHDHPRTTTAWRPTSIVLSARIKRTTTAGMWNRVTPATTPYRWYSAARS